jgi:integrase
LAGSQAGKSVSHYYTLECAWRVHVEPRWASVRVSDFDVLAVETWIDGMVRAGGGVTTVRRAHTILSGILGDAVKGKRLAVNPAKGVENLPSQSVKLRRVYLTADDVHRLADEAGDRGALVLVLGFCGLRWGEAIALKTRDVEFLRRRLSVSASAMRVGGRPVIGTPKTGKARSVPVPGFVLDALSVQCTGKGPDDLVFPGVDGGYMGSVHLTRGWFPTAVRRAGIQRVTPHDLRHTCASLAVSAGSECACAAADARPRAALDEAKHLRRPVRLRSRRGRRGRRRTICTRCAHFVPTERRFRELSGPELRK